MEVLAAFELFQELNWSNIEPCLKFKSNLFSGDASGDIQAQ